LFVNFISSFCPRKKKDVTVLNGSDCMGHLLGPLVLALNCFAALFWPTGSTNKASKQRLNGADAAILSQQINIIINWQASKTFSILKT